MKTIISLITLIFLLTGCVPSDKSNYFKITNSLESKSIYYTMEGTQFENKEGKIPVGNEVYIDEIDSEGSFILKIYSDKTKIELLYSCNTLEGMLFTGGGEQAKGTLFEMTEDKIVQ